MSAAARCFTRTGPRAHYSLDGVMTLCNRPVVGGETRSEKDQHMLAQASTCARCERKEEKLS